MFCTLSILLVGYWTYRLSICLSVYLKTTLKTLILFNKMRSIQSQATTSIQDFFVTFLF